MRWGSNLGKLVQVGDGKDWGGGGDCVVFSIGTGGTSALGFKILAHFW